jgi:hypothetical protein
MGESLAALFDRQHQVGLALEFSRPGEALPMKHSLKRECFCLCLGVR